MPEFSDETDFKLNFNKALEEFKEAKVAGIATRPVVVGPVTFLALGKASKEAKPGFQPISLLPKILPVYKQLLGDLKAAGVESVQVDEPVLVLDVAANYEKQFAAAYAELVPISPKIVLTTYYGRLDSNLSFVAKLPVAGLHIDLDRAPGQLDDVIAAVKPTPIVLSLGLVSGRNIWKNDFEASIKIGRKAVDALGADRVIVATSSSLLHTPVTLAAENKLTADQKDWFSFALEKASEVATIAAALSNSQDAEVAKALEANRVSIAKRREFERTSDDVVRKRVAGITPDMLERKNSFAIRKEIQKKTLNLPKFPTTTIGSFPVSFPNSRRVRYISHLMIFSKPKRSVPPVPSSARKRLPQSNTRNSSRKKFRTLFADKRKSALTSWSTVNPNVTTWFNTLASYLMALFSLKTVGFRATVPGLC